MFKIGEPVIYINGDKTELGIVKEVVPVETQQRLRQDGLFGTPSGETYTKNMYRVLYHSGRASALTDELLLRPLTNKYAFQIIRKDVNNEIQNQKARQIANKIISEVIEPLVGESIDNEEYFDCEDQLTEIIENFKEE
jgi:hypothetical protein